MASIYPKAPVAPEQAVSMDPDEIARRIIEGFETGKITFPFVTKKYGDTYEMPELGSRNSELDKAFFLGPCLCLADDPNDLENPGRGSGDVDTFNQVWNEIHQEKAKLARINPIEHSTEASYVAALQNLASHLDPQKWADGTIAAAGVSSFSALKAKLAEGP